MENEEKTLYDLLPEGPASRAIRRKKEAEMALRREREADKDSRRAPRLAQWPQQTAPEHQLMGIAAANGSRCRITGSGGAGWTIDDDAGVLSFHWPGQEGRGFTVKMPLVETVMRRGIDIKGLDEIRRAANSDTPIILSYILSKFLVTRSRQGIVGPDYTPQIIDLVEVADSCGLGYSKCGGARREHRQADILRRVWWAVLFGATARVEGQRRHPGAPPPINASMLLLGGDDLQNPSLFRWMDAPRRVEIGLSPQWVNYLADGVLQYLPAGEILAGIPALQPTGAYARSMGLYFFPIWRTFAKEAGTGRLMDYAPVAIYRAYPPAQGDPAQFEKNEHRNGTRVLDYHSSGIAELIKVGLVKDHPDADRMALTRRIEGCATLDLVGGDMVRAFLNEKMAPLYPTEKLIEGIIAAKDRRALSTLLKAAPTRRRPS